MSGLNPTISIPPPRSKRVTAIYTYHDERGEPLYHVVREEPKGFYAERRVGGKWTRGLADARRVVYRLPEVLDAIAERRPVFITEGEKDADRLRSLGLTATTSPFGAGNWKSEYAQALRGARVVIVPDQDPAGRRYAQQIADSLAGIAECWTLSPPGILDGEDISDWLDRGHTIRELAPLVKAGLIPAVPQELDPVPQSLEPENFRTGGAGPSRGLVVARIP